MTTIKNELGWVDSIWAGIFGSRLSLAYRYVE